MWMKRHGGKRMLIFSVLLLIFAAAVFAESAAKGVKALLYETRKGEIDGTAFEAKKEKAGFRFVEYDKEFFVSEKLLGELGLRAEFDKNTGTFRTVRTAKVHFMSDFSVFLKDKKMDFGDWLPIAYRNRLYVSSETLLEELKKQGVAELVLENGMEEPKKDKAEYTGNAAYDADVAPKAGEEFEADLLQSVKLMRGGQELVLKDKEDQPLDVLKIGSRLYLPLPEVAEQAGLEYIRNEKYPRLAELKPSAVKAEEREDNPVPGNEVPSGEHPEAALPNGEHPETASADKGVVDEKLAAELAAASEELLKEIPYSKKQLKIFLLVGNKSNQEFGTKFLFWRNHIRNKDISEATADAALEKIALDWKDIALKKAEQLLNEGNLSRHEIGLILEIQEYFTPEESRYAAEKLQGNWKKEAYERAISIEGSLKCSKKFIERSLRKAKFNPDEISYAMAEIRADWKGNAVIAARKYDTSQFSKQVIYEELIGLAKLFTPEEAKYAIDQLN